MKLLVEKAVILEALQKVQSIVGQRTTLPILSNVLIQAEGDTLSLMTTDLEVSVKTSVEADITEAGATTLPARRLFSICREMPNPQIEIDVDVNNVASISSGAAFFKLVGLPEEDFPPLPVFDSTAAYTLDQSVFKEMLQKTSYAASTDESRYILNGSLLSFKEGHLTIVSTDGRRLALIEQEVNFPVAAESNFVIPTKTVNELIKTLGEENELKISSTETQVSFEFSNILIISKLIEGTYPNFRQVIPAHSEQRVAIDRDVLLTALKRVSLLSDAQTSSVKLSFGENQLELVTNTPEVGEARETLPIKYDGPEITIAFNPVFVMDPLKHLESDEVYFELTDELSPGVIKSNVPFLYVIMPIRVA
ncbi:DNA polymerase III subunit beta [Verrucomicrobiota bacterium]